MDLVSIGDFGVLRSLTVPEIPAGDGVAQVVGEETAFYGASMAVSSALARLGFETAIIGSLGTDIDSKSVQTRMTEAGVDISSLSVKRGRGPHRISLTDGARTIRLDNHAGGSELQLGDINLDMVSTAGFVFLSGASDEKQLWLQKQLVSGLQGPRVIVDLDSYAGRGMEEIRAILQSTHLALCTEGGLKRLTGLGYEDAVKEMLSEGVDMVGTLIPEEGCTVSDGSQLHVSPFQSIEGGMRAEGYEAFMAGMLFGIVRGEALDMAVEFGSRMIDMVTTPEGGYPTKDELLGAMEAPPEGVDGVDFVAEK